MKPKKEKIIRSLLLIYVILVSSLIFSMLYKIYFTDNYKKNKVAYNDFLKMVKEKKVDKVYIDFDDSTFSFTTVDKQKKYTDNPKTSDFKKYLLGNNIEVKEINNESFAYVYDILKTTLYLSVILYVIKSVTSGLNNKNIFKLNVNKATKNGITLDKVVLNKDIKKEISSLIDFLKNPKKYQEAGAKLPKGIIFYGPPGTGKTLTAKAIAGEANVPFFYMSGSDFVEMYVGLGAKRVRELFQQARQNAPCIIFIDEIDAVGTNRGEHSNPEKDQTINALLSELDGFNGSEGIIVIAATNRLEDLDPALIRAGRFDKHIAIPLPDLEERLSILKLHANNKKISKNVDLENWAKMTIGFSGAGIETLINEATIISVMKDKKEVDEEDMYDAFYKIVLKGHKKELKKEDENIKLVAWHEAGHAVATKLLTENSVPKVTIIPSTNGTGGVTFVTPKKFGLHSKEELLNSIKVMYAGRIAEYLLLGDADKVTTGAQNDILNASNIIKDMIINYGMSTQLGLINPIVFNIKNEAILQESIRLSKRLENETYELLKNNLELLKEVADTLMEKETLSEEELDEIVRKYKNA